jgi:hypothetical protein
MTFYAVTFAEVTIAVIEGANISSALENAIKLVKPEYRWTIRPDEKEHNTITFSRFEDEPLPHKMRIEPATPQESINAPWVGWEQFAWFSKEVYEAYQDRMDRLDR